MKTDSSILVFEMICGGGCFRYPDLGPPDGSLFQEGCQMLVALVDEFLAQTESRLIIPLDARVLPAVEEQFKRFNGNRIRTECVESSKQLDAIIQQSKNVCVDALIVAPEIQNALGFFTSLLEQLGYRLLSPGSAVVEIGSDKWKSFQFMKATGIPTPDTALVRDGLMPTPALNGMETKRRIRKPRFGAGSVGVCLIDQNMEFDGSDVEELLIQEWVAGMAASMGAIRYQKDATLYLPAVEQILSANDLAYLGCRVIESPDYQTRARNLCEKVVNALPESVGYLGVDLVLDTEPGHLERGRPDDRVIEINPRLTTSFCETRKYSHVDFFNRMMTG